MPERQFSFNYYIGFPSGNFGDFIGENSFRGFSFDYDHYLNEKVSIGGYVGWSIFHEIFDRQTYDFEGGAINIKQWRYSHAVPIILQSHYHV